ncbi:hypothetical protein ACFOLG_06125 [Vogesella facilis]|uniref:Uncharacterized protein n=1 Tax=Vogesella facilis TaxID=1655232 RepID=A0ABV7RBN4_9NEIS
MEFSSFDSHCIEMLNALPNRHSRHCFRSALNHLERAEKLFEVDSVMACFRCITAEEEAAAGLMHCLKEKDYDNAAGLKPRDHKHKSAVIVLFSVLGDFVGKDLVDSGIVVDLSVFEEGDGKKLKLSFEVPTDNKIVTFFSDPPLNVQLIAEGKKFSYRQQIYTHLEKKGHSKMKDHLVDLANFRNKLLYAGPAGFPSEVKVEEKFFGAYKSRVMAMLRAYLLVVPYNEKQIFAQDSLDVFLSMVNGMDLDGLSLDF